MNFNSKMPIYLDYNATTPHHPEVISAMRPFLEEHFGNPSSSHWYGTRTKDAIEKARGRVASLLGARPGEIVFTSGGTESNNFAIKGAALANQGRGNHIITTQIEHPAVTEVCGFLEKHGFEISYLPVDECGMVLVSEIEKAITPETVLITVMHANNEVGTIQPIKQISRLARDHGVIMHTDAAQSVGKIPTDVDDLGVDLLSVAGHKLYAPKGIGALYVRSGVHLNKFMHGADHEQGRRAGTENVLEIAGLGKASEIAKRDIEKNARHTLAMRKRLHDGLKERLQDIRLNGYADDNCLPNTLSLSLRGLDADDLLSKIKDDLAASAGAACHSGGIDVSTVLKAMNVPVEWARGTVRFSTGIMTTEREIDEAIDIISNSVEAARNTSVKSGRK